MKLINVLQAAHFYVCVGAFKAVQTSYKNNPRHARPGQQILNNNKFCALSCYKHLTRSKLINPLRTTNAAHEKFCLQIMYLLTGSKLLQRQRGDAKSASCLEIFRPS